MSKVPESLRKRRGRSGATGRASLGRIAGRNIKRVLVEANFSEAERRAVAALCDGPHSARGLAKLLGLSHFLKANQLVGGAARKVFDAAPRNPFIRKWRSEDDYGVGVIAAERRFKNDKNFYWEIRPEVKQAFIDLGWYPSPDVARGKCVRI